MASSSSGARPSDDRRPDGVSRLRQSEPTDALWHLAEQAPETVRRAILAQWADHTAYPYP